MNKTLYDRIKELCTEHNITISELENKLNFGGSTMAKWGKSSSPSSDKVAKVADYFNVSTDYLLGRSVFRETVRDVLKDEDVISIQRARQAMTKRDREKWMTISKEIFDYAFSDRGDDSND